MTNLDETLSLFGNKIMVLESAEKSVSAGGVKISSGREKKEHSGSVVLVSQAMEEFFSAGDIVYFPKFGGVEMSVAGVNYKIFEKREIFFKYYQGEIIAVNDYIIIDKNARIVSSGKVKLSAQEHKERTSGIIVNASKDVNELLKVGSEVVFSKFAGFETKIDNKDFIVIQESEILILIK